MKMTLSNGTELQLNLAPGGTVKITKTADGEKIELDGVTFQPTEPKERPKHAAVIAAWEANNDQ